MSHFLFGTLFSFIINLGPCRLVSVHSDRYNQCSAHVRPVHTIINKLKYNYSKIQCVFSSHADISIFGMVQDLLGLLTKLIILIIYIVKYLWFFKSYIVHLLIIICIYIYILYYHTFLCTVRLAAPPP